jgi:HSP20 family molecular chaperone IbpA
MKEPLKDFMLADGPLFRPAFYTTAMAYDRREREPFPPVNIYYWGGLVLVQALLPGLGTGDVGVRMEEGKLIIEGAVPRREGRYYHEERYTGPFCRKLSLGVEVAEKMRVSVQDGILHVILRRRKEA